MHVHTHIPLSVCGRCWYQYLDAQLFSLKDYVYSSQWQVNKVGLKVRAALITEVYRKSLSVNLTTMSRYSTGQVCHCVCHTTIPYYTVRVLVHVVMCNIKVKRKFIHVLLT